MSRPACRAAPAALALALALALVLSASPAASAASGPGSGPVGAKQYFIGLVNGKIANAGITVVCPGPARPGGQAGGILSGQTLEVESPLAIVSTSGYTGAAATDIAATLIYPSATTGGGKSRILARFKRYGHAEPFPAKLKVPCSGSAVISFVPEPTSTTAKPYVVKVTFDNVAVAPVR